MKVSMGVPARDHEAVIGSLSVEGWYYVQSLGWPREHRWKPTWRPGEDSRRYYGGVIESSRRNRRGSSHRVPFLDRGGGETYRNELVRTQLHCSRRPGAERVPSG